SGSCLPCQPAPSDLEVVENALGRLASLEDGGDHQIGAPDHVAAGKYLRVAGLVLEMPLRRCSHAALAVGLDFLGAEPLRRTRAEAEGDYYRVCRQYLFGPGNGLGAAATARIRLPETGLHDLDAFYPTFADNRDRLAVEEEFHPLFLGVLHFPA